MSSNYSEDKERSFKPPSVNRSLLVNLLFRQQAHHFVYQGGLFQQTWAALHPEHMQCCQPTPQSWSQSTGGSSQPQGRRWRLLLATQAQGLLWCHTTQDLSVQHPVNPPPFHGGTAATAMVSEPADCLSPSSQGFPSCCTKKASYMRVISNVYPIVTLTLAGSKPSMQSTLSHWCIIFLALSLQQVDCKIRKHNVTASLLTKKKDLLQKTHCLQFYGDFLSKAI